MDWSKVILKLIIALITEQLMQWSPHVAKWLIYASTRLLPEGLSDRMLEEWQAALNDIDGKLCKLIFAMQTYHAALSIRQESLGQLPIYKLLGKWGYNFVDPESDFCLAGHCLIGFGTKGLYFKGVSIQVDKDQVIEEMPVVHWHSTSVRFKWLTSAQKVGLNVRYMVTVDQQTIPGEFTLSYPGNRFRNCLEGHVTRSPFVNANVKVKKLTPQYLKGEDSP